MGKGPGIEVASDYPQNVVRVGWVSLLMDVSSEMLYAITPLFLTLVLGASMSILGLIEGVAEGTASVLKGVSGWHSDRIRKRRIFMFGGYGLSALSKPLLAIAGAWPAVLLARFMDRFGKGLRGTARDALIADSISPERRGWAFGLHRAMDTAGALIGVAISLVLLLVLQQRENAESAFRLLYWLAFLPGAAAVLLIFAVREIPPLQKASPLPAGGTKEGFGSHYSKVLILFSLFALANSSDAFLLLRAKSLGLSVVAVIAAYLCYNASYSALSYPIGKLADRVPKEKILAFGLIVYSVVYLGFAVTQSAWLIWPLFVGYGIYIAMTEGVSKALISNLVDSHIRGTALGLFNMVIGILAVLASLIAGILWDRVSPSAPFYLGALLALISGLGFLFLNSGRTEAA